MGNKLRTAAVATAVAVAGTTLALVGGLPASADGGEGAPGTEYCDHAADGSGWTDHLQGHNDHMGAGMGFDEMNPDGHMGSPMDRSGARSMDQGRPMGR